MIANVFFCDVQAAFLGRFTALKSSLHWPNVKRIKKQLKKPSTVEREGHWMMRCRVICFYRHSPIAFKRCI